MTFRNRPISMLLSLAAAVAIVASGCADDDSVDEPAGASEVVEAPDNPTTVPAEQPAAEDIDTSSSDHAVVEEVGTEGDADGAAPATSTTSADGTYLGSYDLIDEEFGTIVSVTVADGMRIITSNALPDHETGDFPNDGNPNEITAQDLSWSFSTEPTFVGASTDVRTVGVAVNGVKFEPGTGETVTCLSGEQYRIEALQDSYNLGLDFNNAHVQPGGEYHYHGISQMLVEAYESEDDLVHVGFAADGFLMFYSKSGAYSSSYQLRDGVRSGTDCVATGPNDPSVAIEGTTRDGVYASDWEFANESGDLDECNGITVDGQYIYVITDTYPFVSRCLNGEFAGDQPGGGSQEGGGDSTPFDFGAIAAELGVDEAALAEALGRPPFDVTAAAESLGIPVEELQAVLPGPPGS